MIEKTNTESQTYRAESRTEHFLISAASGGKENKIPARRRRWTQSAARHPPTARHVMMSSESNMSSLNTIDH